jgi:radical SAM protein with 4Fe4S-binding SPASM domain
MLYVELTQNCNLKCNMCRSGGGFDPSKNMPHELFARIVSELMPYATMVDLRGWGESTILPTFAAQIQAAAASGVRLRLVTNGLAITEEMWTLILQTDGVIAVSIDAVDSALARDLGRGDVGKALAHVRVGAAVQRRLGTGHIYLNSVVSTFNCAEIDKVIAVAAELGVTKVVLSPIKTSPGAYAQLSLSRVDLRALLERAAARGRASGVTIHLAAALEPDLAIAEALPTTCSSPWSHAVISYNGELLFCDHLINHFDYSMGNIVNVPFRQVWNGAAFQSLRRAHVAAETSRSLGECFRKCTWCYSNRYQDSEPAPIPGEETREVSSRTRERLV